MPRSWLAGGRLTKRWATVPKRSNGLIRLWEPAIPSRLSSRIPGFGQFLPTLTSNRQLNHQKNERGVNADNRKHSMERWTEQVAGESTQRRRLHIGWHNF